MEQLTHEGRKIKSKPKSNMNDDEKNIQEKITVHVFYRSSFSEENRKTQRIWVERSSTNIGG